MPLSRIIIGLVTILAIMITIPILLAWSGSRRRLRVPRQAGGVAVLRMPGGHFAILAAVAFAPFAAISGMALGVTWDPGAEANRWILGGVMGLAGLVAGGYLLLLELRGCLRLDDQAVVKVGALRSRRLAWSEVARLTFNSVNHWFFLTGPDGRTIYFAEGLHGIADFAELALAHLPKPVLEANPNAVEALHDLVAM
jgi:hypothetical protein